MNIIENKKKLAIIGNGTAGSLSSAFFNRNTNWEVEWYFDPNIKPQSVGEGSTIPLPFSLYNDLDFQINDLEKIEGTLKRGVRKIDWNGNGDYMSDFPLSNAGLHFNAVKLQQYTFNKLKSQINIIPKHINDYNQVDCNYIIDCSGKPSNYTDYHQVESINLNSAYVVACDWDYPKFEYTLCIARPYGWVFGIPLQSRCSIGYLFNKDINTLEEVKEDIQNIFLQYNLNPSNKTQYLNFNNYYKKKNFTDRVAYNGNSSFFLEPMEATSTGMISTINHLVGEIIEEGKSIEEQNNIYLNENQEIEGMISLHYFAGSKFQTKFWEIAKLKAEKYLTKFVNKPKFLEIYNLSKNYVNKNIQHVPIGRHNIRVGQWNITNYNNNLIGLNLYDKINKLIWH